MKRLLLSLFLVGSCLAADIPASKLQEASVTVLTSRSSGSGSLFTRTNAEGNVVTFCWTAAHVVSSERYEYSGIMDGVPRQFVAFNDVTVSQPIVEDDRIVGSVDSLAEVIRYSNMFTGEDLAVLRLRMTRLPGNSGSITFYRGADTPKVGTEVVHVGSLLGPFGGNSFTPGVVSFNGRLLDNVVYDQTSVVAYPGSSGGGVFLRDGRFVGMLVRGAGVGYNLIVPVRRLEKWAKKAGVLWAIDAAVPMPSAEKLELLPVEHFPPPK